MPAGLRSKTTSADAKQDDQSAGQTYISGIWQGAVSAYRGSALPIPSQHCETIQRKADHFEALLGVLKILSHATSPETSDRPYWLSRAQAVIAKAEAILAGEPDPED